MTTIFVNLLCFGLLLTSIFSITSKNPVISVIFLISTFVQAAGYLILIGVNFIGISYIVIYVGAIAVLFLFVIMMINIKLTDILETGYNYTKNLPLAIFIVTLFIFIFSSILPYSFNNIYLPYFESFGLFNDFVSLQQTVVQLDVPQSGEILSNELNNITFFNSLSHTFSLTREQLLNNFSLADTFFTKFEQIQVLGHNLYTYGAFYLIILSVILLLAMFATIIISKKNKNI
jgi:NADH-ubiquinone oxidoreductase chain 6